MSHIVKRGISTLIPPKIATPGNLGSNPNAKRMANVVGFYKALPQGQSTAQRLPGFFGKYKEKHFDKDSAKPLIHIILGLAAFGYVNAYFFHLRYEKQHH
ncbi:ATP synthase subunit f, mitochondrial [Trichomonascus vanleenenianus]|uniref:F1F0 ATP synthase subunit f n=1 Tax=Trichomonascus vanleenenianus TaxID=2268995 RepID=UPI003EC99210